MLLTVGNIVVFRNKGARLSLKESTPFKWFREKKVFIQYNFSETFDSLEWINGRHEFWSVNPWRSQDTGSVPSDLAYSWGCHHYHCGVLSGVWVVRSQSPRSWFFLQVGCEVSSRWIPALTGESAALCKNKDKADRTRQTELWSAGQA